MDSKQPLPGDEEPTTISAEDARGGDIILRSRAMRLIFIAGLIGIGIVVLLLRFG